MHEKRMRKLEAIRGKLAPPALAGPADADLTLVGWGSTWGVIHETIQGLSEEGITANHLHIKYLHPFHADEVTEILSGSQRIIVVENNSSGQFARFLRAETGIKADDQVLKYDGEPFTPGFIIAAVRAILDGRPLLLDVSQEEAREMAYHYIRINLANEARPAEYEQVSLPDYDESLWKVTLVGRKEGEPRGSLLIGLQTGATYGWQEGSPEAAQASSVAA
jgi:TPP-dependent indolepyruvate ferredoxin oxidoreductase alpha subunit